MLYCFNNASAVPFLMPTRASSSDTPLRHLGDRVGFLASLICALHCAALPLVLAAVPTLGFGVAARMDFDQAFTVFATVLGVASLGLGWRRHRAFAAWLLLIPGLALVWSNSFTTLHEHSAAHALMMVSGGLAIAAAHLVNFRLSCRAQTCRVA